MAANVCLDQLESGLQPGTYSGHFGFLFIRRDAQAEPDRRMRAVDQQGLEAMLAARADALGIDVRRGCAVTGFTEQADGIEVAWTAPAGSERVRCAYLVGCDGGGPLAMLAAAWVDPCVMRKLTLAMRRS